MDLLHWSSIKSESKIIGVDEAGRGCLCGPVYAAAVVFNPKNSSSIKHYKDSKLLSAKAREDFFKEIMSNHFVGIGSANSTEIDKINILQATFLAMRRAVESLKNIDGLFSQVDGSLLLNGHVVVDGNQKIPKLEGFSQSSLVKGDQLVAEISAASIIAKVSRDHYLDQLDEKYPEYEFRKHKGYGTALHKTRIKELGPCPEHRITFKGVREYVGTNFKSLY